MATKRSIHVSTTQETSGMDEKTPLLISVAEDITPTTSAATTPSGATVAFTGSKPTSNTPRARNLRNENPYLQRKVEEIEFLLSQPEIDLWKLREFALSPGGLVNDTIRKRAWPKLVGLDHKYDPLPMDEIAVDQQSKKKSSLPAAAENDAAFPSSKSQSQSQSVVVPTIEIDAQHELLKDKEGKTNGLPRGDLTQTSTTLIVESVDADQIDRDVARCTWHLLTGSQRSRHSQHRSITKNSTRGKGFEREQTSSGSTKASNQRLPRSHRHHHSAKYRRNRKVTVLLHKKQNRLANLINLTLVQSYDRSDGRESNRPSPNRLRYYQGYHDVACIFLHALGGAGSNKNTNNIHSPSNRIYRHYSSGDLELPSKVLCQVSFSHFSDALRSDFLRFQTGLKLILFPLLSKIDPEVHNHLSDADMEPFFCLSWILTWFAHDVRDTRLVKRLFDAFLVGHPALPLYASLAMITYPYNRQMIMETDCDFAALHQCLATLPKHSCKVGYKVQRVDGFDTVVTYVSDDEGDGAVEDSFTIITNTDSYLEEEQSEFDDEDDSQTFDTRSNHTHDTIYTEWSFPTSVNSIGQFSGTGLSSSFRKPTSISTTGGSIASGSLASLQERGTCESSSCPTTDQTLISMDEPDFLSNESTLVSGKWDESLESGTTCNTGGNPAPMHSSDDKNNTEKESMFAIDDRNPVPFESVLDNAVQLMKDYPPHELVALAKAYYQDDWDNQLSLLSTATTNDQQPIDVQEIIGLLRPTPPPWSVLPSSTSDWMDKQKQRQDLGLKPTSRKDRRRRKQNKNLVAPRADTIDEGATADKKEVDPMDYVRSNPEDLVVAALGFGPGMEAKKRQRKRFRQEQRRRKRRRALMIGCGVLVIGALATYGGLKMVGNGDDFDNRENVGKSDPLVRRLRADPSVDNKTKGNESIEAGSIRKAASSILPRLKNISQEPLLSIAKNGTPSFRESPKSNGLSSSSSSSTNASDVPKKASLSQSSTPTIPSDLPAPTAYAVVSVSSSGRTSLQSSSLPDEKSPILNGVVRKTKLFFKRFAHHLWIVCRGFTFPFRFLQHPNFKLKN